MTAYVALLRGVNVGGANRLPMSDLRDLCADLGLGLVQTYIASGNIAFAADGEPTALERTISDGIEDRFGLRVPVVVRSRRAWAEYVTGNPFIDASADRPNLVMLAIATIPPPSGAAEALQSRAAAGERVRAVGDALWIDFASGSGRSKITPAALDRAVGAPVTTRNWRTVLALNELLDITHA